METKLLQKAKLIIWDECTMAHRNTLHILHKTLEDLRTGQGKFGGVTILLSGDFRQTLPVVPRGMTADELNASLIASSLRRHIKVLRLKRNMRVELMGNDEAAKNFARDLLKLGDGRLPIDSDGLITLPFGQMVSTREELKEKIFQNFQSFQSNNLPNKQYLAERAILAQEMMMSTTSTKS